MTPLTTRQWPLSPSGTFQPAKSLPLNRATKPAGASSADKAVHAAMTPNIRNAGLRIDSSLASRRDAPSHKPTLVGIRGQGTRSRESTPLTVPDSVFRILYQSCRRAPMRLSVDLEKNHGHALGPLAIAVCGGRARSRGRLLHLPRDELG